MLKNEWKFKIGDLITYSKCYPDSTMYRFKNYNRRTGDYGDAKPIMMANCEACEYREKPEKCHDYTIYKYIDEIVDEVEDEIIIKKSALDTIGNIIKPAPEREYKICAGESCQSGEAWVTGWGFRVMSEYYYSAGHSGGYDYEPEYACGGGKREKVLLCKESPSGKEFIVRVCDAEKLDNKE